MQGNISSGDSPGKENSTLLDPNSPEKRMGKLVSAVPFSSAAKPARSSTPLAPSFMHSRTASPSPDPTRHQSPQRATVLGAGPALRARPLVAGEGSMQRISSPPPLNSTPTRYAGSGSLTAGIGALGPSGSLTTAMGPGSGSFTTAPMGYASGSLTAVSGPAPGAFDRRSSPAPTGSPQAQSMLPRAITPPRSTTPISMMRHPSQSTFTAAGVGMQPTTTTVQTQVPRTLTPPRRF